MLSGDLPSRSGAAELRELGFAETRRTVTKYQEENHFTFLTAEGQAFAINHLVNTHIHVNVEDLLRNALAAHEEIARLCESMKDMTTEDANEVMRPLDKPEFRQLINSCIIESIRLNSRLGGAYLASVA